MKPDSVVFVKPNFCLDEYLPSVTTSPQFLDELLRILKSRCSKVIVGESNAHNFYVEAAFKSHNTYEICKNRKVELYNLSKLPTSWVETRVGNRNIRVEVSKLVMEADVVITTPVLKTHPWSKVTISLKNQFGCIPDSMRLLYHSKLDYAIVAMNKILKPQLTLIDATYALNGGGVVYKKMGSKYRDPIRFDTIIISDDLVAADSIGCYMMGYKPSTVRHIKLAEAEQLGTTNLNKILIHGQLPVPVKCYVKRDLMDNIVYVVDKNYLSSKLVFDSPITPVLYSVFKARKIPKRIF
jgi:uncharacterized protein (DUF362 family)